MKKYITTVFVIISFLAIIPFAYAELENVTEYKFIKKWGGAGEDDGQFLRPHDLDFSPDEEILYIADRDGARIQAFDKEGNFLFKWGKKGTGEGEFTTPYGVDVD
ncbi:MAG: hypothetical protein ACPKQO_01525, partial [Nitrososphaeraceae archaeon]